MPWFGVSGIVTQLVFVTGGYTSWTLIFETAQARRVIELLGGGSDVVSLVIMCPLTSPKLCNEKPPKSGLSR